MAHDGSARVEIDRDHLEILLFLARIGDTANSVRSWRSGFRRHAVCSGDDRDADCLQCQAFTAAELTLGDGVS